MLKQKRKQKDDNRNLYWLLAFGLLLTQTEEALATAVNGLVQNHLTPNQLGANVLTILHPAHGKAYSIGAQSIGVDLMPEDAKKYINSVMREQEKFLERFMGQLEEGDHRYRKTIEELYPEATKNAKERLAKDKEYTGLTDSQKKEAEEAAWNELSTDEKAEYLREKLNVDVPPIIGGDEVWNEKAIQARMRLYAERVRGTANWGAVDMLAATDEIRWVLDTNENHCEDCPEWAKQIWLPGTLPGVPGSANSICGVNCKCRLELLDGTIIQF